MDPIDRQVAINALRHVDEYNGRSIETIRNLPSAEPHWIPVTEQTLPNHNSVVVVCGEKGTWDFGTYRGHMPYHINFWNWKKNTVKEVQWWMYKKDALPEPYERSDDAETD